MYTKKFSCTSLAVCNSKNWCTNSNMIPKCSKGTHCGTIGLQPSKGLTSYQVFTGAHQEFKIVYSKSELRNIVGMLGLTGFTGGSFFQSKNRPCKFKNCRGSQSENEDLKIYWTQKGSLGKRLTENSKPHCSNFFHSKNKPAKMSPAKFLTQM